MKNPYKFFVFLVFLSFFDRSSGIGEVEMLRAAEEGIRDSDEMGIAERALTLGDYVYKMSRTERYDDPEFTKQLYYLALGKLEKIQDYGTIFANELLRIELKEIAEAQEWNEELKKSGHPVKELNLEGLRRARMFLCWDIKTIKTPEMISGLLQLLDQTERYGLDYDISSSRVAIILMNQMLIGFPGYDPNNSQVEVPHENWLKWREDLRRGKATLTFRGDPNTYLLSGEIVPKDFANSERGQNSGKIRSQGDVESPEVGLDAEKIKPVQGWPLWLALGLLCTAMILFALRKGRRVSS